MLLSHDQIWAAIDTLAARHALTASGLARRAGLDPTTFNKSKRLGADGRPRWPSTESIAKVIEATRSSLDEFAALVEKPTVAVLRPAPGGRAAERLASVPLIGFAQAGGGGYFDDAGFPSGQGWDEIDLPRASEDNGTYALQISGDSMLPLYRDGDRIIVSRHEPVRRGDRVVVKTRDGEIMAKVLQRRTAECVELASLNREFPDHRFRTEEIEWIARILWASQ